MYIYNNTSAKGHFGAYPGATQRDPHPQKSDVINIRNLNCSEQAWCCVY